MKFFALVVVALLVSNEVTAHEICPSCQKCHTCGRTVAQIEAEKRPPKTATTTNAIKRVTYKPVVQVESEPEQVPQAQATRPTQKLLAQAPTQPVHQTQHPPFSNEYNYPRKIDPQLQARAQREAELLARYSFTENQRRWVSSKGALGHPLGVPAGYVGGTGCSWPEPKNGWKRTTPNEITTCEPGGARH